MFIEPAARTNLVSSVSANGLHLVTSIAKWYRLFMIDKLIITEEPEDPEFNRRMAQFRRNGDWLTEHGAFVFKQFRGRHIAVSEGEVFVANDAWEAQRLAKEKHPDDVPWMQFIPVDDYDRIYACFKRRTKGANEHERGRDSERNPQADADRKATSHQRAA
jgi:hypothetical protein